MAHSSCLIRRRKKINAIQFPRIPPKNKKTSKDENFLLFSKIHTHRALFLIPKIPERKKISIYNNNCITLKETFYTFFMTTLQIEAKTEPKVVKNVDTCP